MDQIGKLMEQDKAQVPNLDWLDLSAADKDNLPTPNNVEILPQLQEAWSHPQERSAELIPNVLAVTSKNASEVSKEAVTDLINQAKKEMMAGLTGKALAAKLSSLFLPEVIRASKDELSKLSSEQGLLGNVYLDLSPFESCKEAARVLGKNKVRVAKYVVGNPTRHVCSSHHTGHCSELGKRVLASMDYTKNILSEYTNHLRIAGVIDASATIDSKESLREAFLKRPTKTAEVEAPKVSEPVNLEKASMDLATELEKTASIREKQARRQRFHSARPILAYIQDQMLRGKIGDALKESIQSKFLPQDIATYAPEIKRLASLQGLLGNVYVDVSYYNNADEAVKAIKTASTSPLYVVHTMKENEYDDTLVKVAKATGCTEFPKNGKIDKSVALSYISDLQFSNRISSDTAESLKSQVSAGSNVLGVIRDAFMATQKYKRQPVEGGVQMSFGQGTPKKAADRDSIRRNTGRALEAGVSLSKVEDKLSMLLPTAEAIGMARQVLASLDTVDAVCLTKCASEKYQFKSGARIKQAEKCKTCIYVSPTACIRQGMKFAGARDLDKAFLDLDPKTAKVQFKENPDLSREDMKQPYDLSDSFGSGMTIAMDNLRKKEAQDIELGLSREGLDGNLSTM